MRKTNLKKGIVAVSVAVGITGGLVAGLALGVPGFAGAQANTSTIVAEGHGPHEGHGPRGAKLDAVAAVLGITTAELKIEINSGKSIADVASAKGVAITRVTAALVVEFKAHLDEKVASGVHTQAEADAKLAEFTTRVTVMVNKVRPAGALGMGEGRGMGSHGMGKGHGPRGAKLDAVAAVLGITTAELKTEINSGKSIADVASAKGVAITRVTDALVSGFKAHLDEKVASGVHTQAEADAKLAEFTTRVTVMVNKVRPAGALGMGEGRGMGSHGMGKGHGPGEGMGKGHGPRGEAATAPSAKA